MSTLTRPHTMNAQERELLLAATDGREPVLTLRTATRVDTGRWLRASPLWLNLTADQVVLIAASRRACVERAPIDTCAESWYCHITGQLVLHPAASLAHRRLTMSPGEALRVLNLVQSFPQPAGDVTTGQAKDRHASIHP